MTCNAHDILEILRTVVVANNFDYLGPENCSFNVFAGGQLVEFKADCGRSLYL